MIDALPSELTDTAIKTLLIWHSVRKEGYPPVYDVSHIRSAIAYHSGV